MMFPHPGFTVESQLSREKLEKAASKRKGIKILLKVKQDLCRERVTKIELLHILMRQIGQDTVDHPKIV